MKQCQLEQEWPLHLFEYSYKGSKWCFEIQAPSEEDAIKRINAIYYARYKGIIEMKLPATTYVGLFVKIYCFVKNLFKEPKP